MKLILVVDDGFASQNPGSVLGVVRDALAAAEIPVIITEMTGEEGVLNILDCSTVHVTLKDIGLLSEVAGEGRSTEVLAYPNECGAFVYVPGPPEIAEDFETKKDYLDVLRDDGFSESFIKVLEFAASKGCNWIKFDGDGHEWTELDNCKETQK